MTHPAQAAGDAIDTPRRDRGLDAARGVGILLVVLGHALIRSLPVVAPGAPGAVELAGIGAVRMTPAVDVLLAVVYSFHMPLLAYVSGHAFSRSSVGYGARFIARRALGLLVPFLAWLLVAWVIAGDHTPAGLLMFGGRALLDPQSPGALWFLYALFGSSAVLALVMRLGGSDRMLLASALLVGAAGVLPLGPYGNILGLSDIAWLYPFVAAGVISARHRKRLEDIGALIPLALALWAASLPLIWPVLVPGPRWWAADVEQLLAGIGPIAPLVTKGLWAGVRVIGALAGTYAAFALATRLRGVALGVAAWLGRRTLGVYATHSHILLYAAPLFVALATPVRVVALLALGVAGGLAITRALETTALTRKVFLGIRA